jgi:transglutaminase-like putative cysteine protease
MLARNLRQSIVLIAVVVLILSRAVLADVTLALPAGSEAMKPATIALPRPNYSAPSADEFATNVRQMVQRYQPLDFDPAARAAALGEGVEPAFQFVRDQVRFESYSGAFRGAAGAYRDRAANAADRALLLAELLKRKKIDTRFAHGKLSRESAEALVARMFDTPTNAQDPAHPSASAQTSEVLRRIRARAARDYSVVCAALGANLPSAASPSRDQLIEEITPHVWVQANVNDQWVDLDPSFADATVGKRYCDAEGTSEALDEDLQQRVTIRIIAETLDGTALKSETMLELTKPVHELADRQIFLVHSPPSGLKSLGKSLGGSGTNDTWSPMLWIDGDISVGKQIVYHEPAGAQKPAGGLAGALDALGGGDDKAAAADASPQFVAEWIELQITFPGGRIETTRRELCDRAGAAWRRAATPDPKALHPLARNDAGPIAAQTVHQLWISAGRHDLSAYAQSLQQLADATRPSASSSSSNAAPPAAAPEQDLDFGQQVWPIVLKNATCVMATDQTILPALNDDPKNVRCYLDSPRIVIFSLNAQPVPGQPDAFTLESEIDLRRDRVRAVAKDTANGAGAARRRIWYGLLEGALEHELAAREAGVLDPAIDAMSTSALLDDHGVVLLGPDAAAQWEQLAANKEAAARLANDLSAGAIAVVPKSVTQAGGDNIGWWAISPTTGDTRAVFESGLHGSVWKGGGGGRYGGGSSGPSVNYVDPKTGNAYSPKNSKGPKGNEYATLVANISLPGGWTLRIAITPRLLSVTIEVTKLLL